MNEKSNKFLAFINHYYGLALGIGSTSIFLFLIYSFYESGLPIIAFADFTAFLHLFLISITIIFIFAFISVLPFFTIYNLKDYKKIPFKELMRKVLLGSAIPALIFVVYIFIKLFNSTSLPIELYFEVSNYPRVFEDKNGRYFTVFKFENDVFEGYDLNKSLLSSLRCQEIWQADITAPSQLMYLLVKKQSDDSYTIPYNLNKLDNNLTLVEYENVKKSITQFCQNNNEPRKK